MIRPLSVLAACVLVLAAAAPAAALGPLEFNLTAGLDFDGELDGDVTIDADTHYSLGLEVVVDFPIIDVGLGAEYGFERGIGDADDLFDDDISSVHAYAVARMQLIPMLYAVGRYGYLELDGDIDELDGGDVWALGLGLNVLGKVRLEVLFNQASVEIEEVELDYDSYAARLIYTF